VHIHEPVKAKHPQHRANVQHTESSGSSYGVSAAGRQQCKRADRGGTRHSASKSDKHRLPMKNKRLLSMDTFLFSGTRTSRHPCLQPTFSRRDVLTRKVNRKALLELRRRVRDVRLGSSHIASSSHLQACDESPHGQQHCEIERECCLLVLN
jgi:hypothetical protein